MEKRKYAMQRTLKHELIAVLDIYLSLAHDLLEYFVIT